MNHYAPIWYVKAICLLLCYCCSFPLYAQRQWAIEKDSFSIVSSVMKEKKMIQWVSIHRSQDGNSQSPLPKVIYAFDGEYQTNLIARTLLHFLETDSSLPSNWLIVGITHSNRRKDLAPELPTNPLPAFPMAIFIQKELLPYVDKHFPNDGNRWVFGHSYGGLAVVHLFLRYTHLFDCYVASDPSLWWNNQCLVQSPILPKSGVHKSLFMGFSKSYNGAEDTGQVQKRVDGSSMHIRSILDLHHYIQLHQPPLLTYSAKYYPEEQHNSVYIKAESDGLRQLLGTLK